MRNIDETALIAAKDEIIFEKLFKSQKPFIVNCAFKITKHYITENDDEWSVAIIAFSDAVKSYNYAKGSFLSYAELMIKNRLIDYFRSEVRHRVEIPAGPAVFDGELSEDDEDLGLKISVTEKTIQTDDNSIKYEIEAANSELRSYGFSFYDLAGCSPKSIKTKLACRRAVLFILGSNEIINEIRTTKQLPIKIIQKNTALPRKLLEHHRKYIIAVTEILSGEYPCLAEYVSYIRKDEFRK